jgi:pseudouridine synthase
MGVKIEADQDKIQVDGRLVRPPAAPVTVMLHKPYGYISSTHDPQGRRVVTDLLRDAFKERLYPVGRLDYDATGLLLLTNDGDLAYRLTHPGYQVPRIYRVTVAGEVSPETLGRLTEGVTVGDRTVTALVEVKKRESGRTVLELVLREGRYHLVKRLLLHVGHPVLKLKRIAFGPLHLGTLPRGDFRMLSREEIEALKTKVQMR